MRKLVLLFAAAAMIASCNKGEKVKPGASEGVIRFTNTSSNPYTIFIGGTSQGTVNGKKYKEISQPAGSYTVGALQNSGYAIYPTKTEGYITIASGEQKEFVFP